MKSAPSWTVYDEAENDMSSGGCEVGREGGRRDGEREGQWERRREGW